MLIHRSRARALGHETLAILTEGRYTSPSGQVVDVRALVQTSVEQTVSYPPGTTVPAPTTRHRSRKISVQNETTLKAAKRLADLGHRVVALNFASAKHPGGGFLGGARAQEESLARSSGLYATLVDNPMYEYHRQRGGGLYSDYTIYSPSVPVFRTDEGALLEQPWTCSFISCPAINAKVVMTRDRRARPTIQRLMAARIEKVLAVATAHGHDTLVLGAWGCGAFGNSSEDIAGLFAQALLDDGPFATTFRQVVFAITDWSDERRFIGPFAQRFGRG